MTKVLGTSGGSWEDTAEEALAQASETIDIITGVEPEEWSADVENGEITQYKTTVEIAFEVQ